MKQILFILLFSIVPIIPVGSTPYQEGIKAGIRTAG